MWFTREAPDILGSPCCNSWINDCLRIKCDCTPRQCILQLPMLDVKSRNSIPAQGYYGNPPPVVVWVFRLRYWLHEIKNKLWSWYSMMTTWIITCGKWNCIGTCYIYQKFGSKIICGDTGESRGWFSSSMLSEVLKAVRYMQNWMCQLQMCINTPACELQL